MSSSIAILSLSSSSKAFLGLYISRQKGMPIVAIFATIWANRKSHIMFVLHGIKKVLADLVNKSVRTDDSGEIWDNV
jgi:hypothetical protein